MSIRIRLTVWYVSLLGIVLILFSATFYGVLKFSLTSEVDRGLEERVKQVVEGIKAENPTAKVLRSGMVNLPQLDIFESQSIYIQITNFQGKPVKRSSNLGSYTLPINPQILNDIKAGHTNLQTIQMGPAEMRLYNVPITFGQEVIGMIQVGKPLNEMKTTLQRIFLFLVGSTSIALIVATLFGILLAHLSLRPIDRITLTAKQIVSAQDLGQRLPLTGNNDELDRLSETINNMLTRLDNFFQAQVRLSADISHELRTPLTIIRGNVDLFRKDTISTEERTDALTTIYSSLDRMTRLVSDLLLLSQADAGMSLNIRTVNVDEVILDVFQQAHALANGVNLKLGHADYETMVNGDADRLKQLLINLLDNAIKHTPEGGYVTLSVYEEQDWVRICVADTGEGISTEYLPHIFDRFYRVKGKKRKGAGLGLAIAKWIAEAHHGSLTAESKPGIGSTFTVRLPLKNQSTPSTPPLNP